MKGEKSKIILIYVLLVIVLALIVALGYVVITSTPKETESNVGHETTVDVNPYPNVSSQCIFSVSLEEYNALTYAGCEGGYTRYDINNVVLNGTPLTLSVIYSDKGQPKAGFIVNNRRVIQKIDNVTLLKFGVFDNKLFVLDTNNNQANVVVINSEGKTIYNLKNELEKLKIKDEVFTANGNNKEITNTNLNPSSFNFADGVFTFATTSDACNNGAAASGTNYQVTYSGEKFNKPEATSPVACY